MKDYTQMLREAVLQMPLSPQEKVNGLNILEQIIEGADVDQLVEQIGSGTVPVTYIMKQPQPKEKA